MYNMYTLDPRMLRIASGMSQKQALAGMQRMLLAARSQFCLLGSSGCVQCEDVPGKDVVSFWLLFSTFLGRM